MHDVYIGLLRGDGIEVQVALQTHDIDLEGICSGLTDLLGELRPALPPSAVDTRDDGYPEVLLGLTHIAEVGI